MGLEIVLNSRRMTRILVSITAILVVMDLTVKLIREFLGYDYMFGIVPLFDFYEEANIPTWYSSVLLLIAAALMFITFLRCQKMNLKFTRHWLGLALFFLFLSIDEASGLHETAGRFLKRTSIQGLMPREESSSWILLAIPLGLFLGIIYLRLFLCMPTRFKRLFALSAALYISGCLGMEWVEILYLVNHPIDLNFYLMTTLEETLEMSGLIVLIYSLLEQLKSEGAEWLLRID